MPYTMKMSHGHGRVVVGQLVDDAKSWQVWQVYPGGETRRVDFRDGWRIPDPSELCTEVRMLNSLRSVCVFSCRIRFAVSQQVKDAIESAEPGVHQFALLKVTPHKDQVIGTNYFMLNVCNRLRAIDGDRSSVPFSLHDGGTRKGYSLSGLPGTQFVVPHEAVSGKAVRMDEESLEHFVSDELRDVITSHGARNLEFVRVAEN